MAFSREDYSRKQTVDLTTAMSQAIADRLTACAWPGPGGQGTIQLKRVFTDWPTFNDEFVPPSGCILPDPPLVYGPSHPTPRLLEETWEPQGQLGFGLYELQEATRDVEVVVRAPTSAERQALLAGIETTFQDPRLLMWRRGARNGVFVPMPGYFGIPCRLTFLSSQKHDDQDTAARNQNEATFVVRAEAKHVMLGPVAPFTLKTVMKVCEGPIPRLTDS